MLLEGKVAVITGAGSGMARASAAVFVREGARVVAADISGAEKDTAAELGDAVVPFHCDVTREDDVEALFTATVEELGRVDAVLNVAGIGAPQPIHELDVAERPQAAVDHREVIEARWWTPEQALQLNLFPPLRKVIERRQRERAITRH